jgi:hypothetical protein
MKKIILCLNLFVLVSVFSSKGFGITGAGIAIGGVSAGVGPAAVAIASPCTGFPSAVDCISAAGNAEMACLAELSPHIQTGGMVIGGMMAAADFMKGGVAESCEKQNKIMGVAQKAITAYNAACSGMKLWCDNSCKTAITAVTAEATAKPTGQAPDCLKSLKLITVKCEHYMFSIAAAGAGLMQIINQSGAAKACKAALSDCSKNPTNPICFVDCSKPEHATKAQCICQKTPNAKGCPGAVAYEAGPGMQTTGNDLTEAPLNIPNPNFDGSGGGDGFVGGPGSGLGGGGSGGAGGGSGADSSNGFSGGGKAADGAGKIGAKRLNTDILSGIDGGGGGGGGGGRGGGAKAANSPYQAYLPGGEKDPARDLASANFAKEVTAGGSKSNWEKITERYQQFRPSLNAGP